MGWQTALGLAWRRIIPLVGCLVAYVLIFMVTFGVALFVGGAMMRTLVFDLPADQVGVVAGLIGMAAALVAAIPLTVLFVYWCLALPLIATENLNAFSALRRSWRLVRGNFWQTLVVVSVAGFVVFAVASLVGIAGMLACRRDPGWAGCTRDGGSAQRRRRDGNDTVLPGDTPCDGRVSFAAPRMSAVARAYDVPCDVTAIGGQRCPTCFSPRRSYLRSSRPRR